MRYSVMTAPFPDGGRRARSTSQRSVTRAFDTLLRALSPIGRLAWRTAGPRGVPMRHGPQDVQLPTSHATRAVLSGELNVRGALAWASCVPFRLCGPA